MQYIKKHVYIKTRELTLKEYNLIKAIWEIIPSSSLKDLRDIVLPKLGYTFKQCDDIYHQLLNHTFPEKITISDYETLYLSSNLDGTLFWALRKENANKFSNVELVEEEE